MEASLIQRYGGPAGSRAAGLWGPRGPPDGRRRTPSRSPRGRAVSRLRNDITHAARPQRRRRRVCPLGASERLRTTTCCRSARRHVTLIPFRRGRNQNAGSCLSEFLHVLRTLCSPPRRRGGGVPTENPILCLTSSHLHIFFIFLMLLLLWGNTQRNPVPTKCSIVFLYHILCRYRIYKLYRKSL